MAVLKVISHTPTENDIGRERKYQDDYTRLNLTHYLSNPEKCVRTGGIGLFPEHAAYEMWLVARSWGNDSRLRARHFVLSFSPQESMMFGTSRWYHMDRIARHVCALYCDNYQIFYAIHRHETHDHIHFVMNPVNYRNGRKYGGKKKDYYDLQKWVGTYLWNQYRMRLQTVSE